MVGQKSLPRLPRRPLVSLRQIGGLPDESVLIRLTEAERAGGKAVPAIDLVNREVNIVVGSTYGGLELLGEMTIGAMSPRILNNSLEPSARVAGALPAASSCRHELRFSVCRRTCQPVILQTNSGFAPKVQFRRGQRP
jgi:hypothetical protein